jgi:diguanylate cyclase (GGDEF)-like protein
MPTKSTPHALPRTSSKVHAYVAPSARMREQIALALHAIDEGRIEAAEKLVAGLLETAVEGELAHVLNAQAALHRATGDILACARVAADARLVAHTHSDLEAEGQAILYTGQAMQMIEDHAAAIRHFEDAEELAIRAHAPHVEARALHRLGISASIIGRHAQAIEYLERSIKTFQKLNSTSDNFNARISLLNAHSRRADAMTDPAEREAASRALLQPWDALAREAEQSGVARIAAIARGNYAITQRYAGDDEGALATLRDVLARYEQFKMRVNIALTHSEIAAVYMHMHRHDEALAAYQRALDYLADGSKREQRNAYVGISEAYEAQGDARAALTALKQARAIEAALTDEEARGAIERRELTISLRRLSDDWERLAKEDTLTMLPNRRALEQWMSAAISRVTAEQPITLLMMDVDHFKQVNDKFGHAIGDRVLRVIADLMRENCRYADLPARFGGEEFVVALPQTDLSIGKVVAQRLNIMVAEYEWQQIHPDLAVTISIGIATTAELKEQELIDTSAAMNALHEAADRRLYQAKNGGRNRVVA